MFLVRIGDTMRVAFASYDNTIIDQHFGSARYWQIYDIDSESTFIETRKIPVTYQEKHELKFNQILTVLEDCEAFFVLQIGESAVAYMILNHKRVFEASGDIQSIAHELIKSDLLNE